ncbi:hypothetical protein BN1804_03333 [Proteus penneri]|uniref:Uncharacterized protein n=1 Tax=Proteus penneri TaxID=102862 RepID=A0A0G4QHJ5_9GAMM|nr:hypothetical protein BN1804_03333 [Proteus penneri]
MSYFLYILTILESTCSVYGKNTGFVQLQYRNEGVKILRDKEYTEKSIRYSVGYLPNDNNLNPNLQRQLLAKPDS